MRRCQRWFAAFAVLALLCAANADEVGGDKETEMDDLEDAESQCPSVDCPAAEERISQLAAQLQTTSDTVSEMAVLLGEVHDQMNQGGADSGSADVAFRDCSDLPDGSPSGVYIVTPGLAHRAPVYCDQETDGGRWTVIQRRADIVPHVNFFRIWDDYKWGFGFLEGEHWWGLQNVWRMTLPLDRSYELRIDLEDFEGGRRFAVYGNFRISSEADGYRLFATNFAGDAGDSLVRQIGARFSTRDRELGVPATNCAETFKGAWWYKDCHDSNLNGLYLGGLHTTAGEGINWRTWLGYNYSLKHVEMKIRPVS